MDQARVLVSITSTVERISRPVVPPATMTTSIDVTAVVPDRTVGMGGKTAIQFLLRLKSLFVRL